MRILFATSEIAPWVKTGGLGDVSADLPAALHDQGIDVRVIVPGYLEILEAFPAARVICELGYAEKILPPVRVLRTTAPAGFPLLIVDCPSYFVREGGPYLDLMGHDWADNHLRFGLLSHVAALLSTAASPLKWKPQVLHCNDWPTGMAAAYLRYGHQAHAATLMTAHNAAFQGIFPPHVLPQLALPRHAFAMDGVEYYGNVSFLKAGLQMTDWLTTVSPNYAREIQTPEFGCGLEGLLRARAAQLTGILNGIDIKLWNPAADRFLPHHYSAADLAGKTRNKRALQRRLRLQESDDVPLLSVVSRLTHQKGLDLLAEIGTEIVSRGAQLVVLGSGEKDLESAFLSLAQHHPQQISTTIGFDERLAHMAEAGADIFVMPSRFEPCGLNQMFSLRYGTIPIVRRTGGLADTVVDCTPKALENGTANGFVFDHAWAAELLGAVDRALDAWAEKPLWQALQHNGMNLDFGWENAAREYAAIYKKLIKPAS